MYTGTLIQSLSVRCIFGALNRKSFRKSSGLIGCVPKFFLKDFRRGGNGRILDRSLGRSASSFAVEPVEYPGGSYDTSLLVKYEHHVAHHLWFGEERGPKKELKVVGHGLKLTSRVPLALP
ncbi:hypothetical protein KIW84_075644 [Lathyrus oleraceus]|uniref:Uncharacterized protein n=1 Tax=Pisum sativum TaxID=3888 RepID=A0A9D4VVI4_PEA|nr:hypothetical protein KIW84_075644 [Pisum sativum]